MAKLHTSAGASPRGDHLPPAPPKPAARCRPCPRCYVPLVLEREYTSRGLSGTESIHQAYVCPACDARFQHSPAENRWKEVG